MVARVKIGGSSYNLCAIGISIMMFTMIVIEILNVRTYLDEIIGVISLVYIVVYVMKNYHRVSQWDFIIFFALFFSIIWGIFSNQMSRIDRTKISILIDAVAETKVIACFFWMRLIVNEVTKDNLIKIWNKISKLYLLIAFLCGMCTLLFDTGMYNQVRYGIPSYNFIYQHAFQFTTVEIAALLFVVLNDYRKKRKLNYGWIILAILTLVMTTKAPAFVFSITMIFLNIYLKRRKKVSIGAVIVVVILILIVGRYQIENYLLKPDTPRNVFSIYSIKTANDYFPYGSGFATFGSDQAARDYSPLYVKYGFVDMWGMSEDNPMFLSDNFWQSAIAQLGWIGFIVYLIPYAFVYKFISTSNYPRTIKALIYAYVTQFYIHGFGSAILSSATGLIGFMMLGIVLNGERCDLSKKDNYKKSEILFPSDRKVVIEDYVKNEGVI